MAQLFAILETTAHMDEPDETLLFKKVYVCLKLAQQAVETAARETWDMIVDPNGEPSDQKMPDVEWNNEGTCCSFEPAEGMTVSWTIETVEVA